MRDRLRRLFPPTGPAYELFDTAVLLLLLALINYVVTDPPATTVLNLSAPLTFASETTWGIALAACGLAAIACSYREDLLDLGYSILVTATVFWSTCFLVSVVLFGGSLRGLGSALIWGWIARRSFRESRRVL